MAGQTILVVEDEPDIRQLYHLWLGDAYDVEYAGDGNAATEQYVGDVDVVILDRNLPGLSGDSVARALTANGYDGMIAMVTARDPDPAIATLPIDDYLTKPIDERELTTLVERLLTRLEVPPEDRSLYAMYTRKIRLEATMTRSALAGSEAYRRLCARIDRQFDLVLDRDPGLDTFEDIWRQTVPEPADFADAIESIEERPEMVTVAASSGQEL